MGWKARKIRKVQEISPQIPICISVCFKNGQSRLGLPIHLENYAIFKALHRFEHHLV